MFLTSTKKLQFKDIFVRPKDNQRKTLNLACVYALQPIFHEFYKFLHRTIFGRGKLDILIVCLKKYTT